MDIHRSELIPGNIIPNVICLILLVCRIFLGDFIQLGEAITFRFNHPKEALRLKKVSVKSSGMCVGCSVADNTV